MNKFKVKVFKSDGDVIDTIVEGDDGPQFDGDHSMYKLLDCSTIEITGARYEGKNYDLYIDEEGRMKNNNFVNPEATNCFLDWLDHEGRMTMIPNIVGHAAIVDPEPIVEDITTKEKENVKEYNEKKTNYYEGGLEYYKFLEERE